MGTRADFYVGRGEHAEWIGSIAMDGYPEGIPASAMVASSEAEFRTAVTKILNDCDHATIPEQGWPWPWTDSATTNYAYAWDDTQVWVSHFGSYWSPGESKVAVFPDMSAIQKVAYGARSGVIILNSPFESNQ